MTDRRCRTCANYAPGQQWCMEWGRNVAPDQSCGRWYSEHGQEVRPVVTTPKRIRLRPRHAYAATVTIGSRLYVSVRALKQIGSPSSVVIEVEPDTGTLIIAPGDGQLEAFAVQRNTGAVGAKALVKDLEAYGFGRGRYVGEVVGHEIRARRPSQR